MLVILHAQPAQDQWNITVQVALQVFLFWDSASQFVKLEHIIIFQLNNAKDVKLVAHIAMDHKIINAGAVIQAIQYLWQLVLQ